MSEVRLRVMEDRDLDDLFAWEQDPVGVEMAAFTRADPSDRAAFDAHYARVRSDPNILHRVIEVDGVLAGMIASFTIEGDREITYWIDPGQWGRGVASAALGALLELELTRPLFGRVASHNAGSARVLEKAGFERIGSDSGFAAGVGRDVIEYIYRLAT